LPHRKNKSAPTAAAMPQFGTPVITVDSVSHAEIPVGATVWVAPELSSGCPGLGKLGAVCTGETVTVGAGAGAIGSVPGLETTIPGSCPGGGCGTVAVAPGAGGAGGT
jgi:hypothetical protein